LAAAAAAAIATLGGQLRLPRSAPF